MPKSGILRFSVLPAAMVAASLVVVPATVVPAEAAQPKNVFEALFPKLKEKRLKRERVARERAQQLQAAQKPVRVKKTRKYAYKVAKRTMIDLEVPPLPEFATVAPVVVGAKISRLAIDLNHADRQELYAEQNIAAAVAAHYKDDTHYFWLNEEGKPNARARSVMKLFATADEFGLDPKDYSVDLIEPGPEAASKEKAAIRIHNEIAFAVSALRYAMDARFGTVNPNRLSGYHDFPEYSARAAEVLTELKSSGLPANKLRSMHPSNAPFLRLKEELASLSGAQDDVIELETKILIKPGQRHDEMANVVAAIRKRASAELLEAHSETLGTFDTAEDKRVYTPELVRLVKAYQKEAGLGADGIIGSRTATRLAGIKASSKIDRVRLAMERMRWLPHDLGARHVFINQPEYRARYVEDGNVDLSMRVVVGKPSNQTNFFFDEIEHVVYNPYWGVPRSIIVNEFRAKSIGNPAYLDSRGYEITGRGGRRISSSSIDWASVGVNPGFSVRQPPGARNALGKLKIMFPNRHAIYMHDTPSKHLFKRQNRAFSHGCIRLHDPQAMAAAVLGKTKGHVNSRIKGPKDQTEKLSVKVPVYVSYFTAWPQEDGSVGYFGDMYGRDAHLMKAIQKTRKAREAGLVS